MRLINDYILVCMIHIIDGAIGSIVIWFTDWGCRTVLIVESTYWVRENSTYSVQEGFPCG